MAKFVVLVVLMTVLVVPHGFSENPSNCGRNTLKLRVLSFPCFVSHPLRIARWSAVLAVSKLARSGKRKRVRALHRLIYYQHDSVRIRM